MTTQRLVLDVSGQDVRVLHAALGRQYRTRLRDFRSRSEGRLTPPDALRASYAELVSCRRLMRATGADVRRWPPMPPAPAGYEP